MLNIKKIMCTSVVEKRHYLGTSFPDLVEMSGVSIFVLEDIFKNQGKETRIEDVEKVAEALGVYFELHEIFMFEDV